MMTRTAATFGLFPRMLPLVAVLAASPRSASAESPEPLRILPATTLQAQENIADWCERQWRTESANTDVRSSQDLTEVLKRWQTFAPKCAGTVAYEVRLAMIQLLLGDIATAREILSGVARIRSPYAHLVQYGYAWCDYYALTHEVGSPGTEDDARRVEQEFQRVVDEQPRFWEGWAVLGSVQTIRGRHAQAIDSLKRGLRSPGSVAGVYRNLTISYAGLGRYEDALAAADEAFKRDRKLTSDPYYAFAFAKANAALGRLDDAEMVLKVIIAKKPDVRSEPEFKKTVEFLKARRPDAGKRSEPK